MRKIGALVAFAGIAAVIVSASPAAAFGIRIGPFHIGLPFGWHHHHRPLYMRASPNEVARSSAPARAETSETVPQGVVSPALVYPSLALPAIFQNVFWPNASQWPFGYQNIFTTAFAKISADQDQRLCQQPLDPNAMVGRISADSVSDRRSDAAAAEARRRARHGVRLSRQSLPKRNSSAAGGAAANDAIADPGFGHGDRHRPPAACRTFRNR